MGRKQTRNSLSLSGTLHRRLNAFAKEHNIPMAQLASQGIEAVLEGRVSLSGFVEPNSSRANTMATRDALDDQRKHDRAFFEAERIANITTGSAMVRIPVSVALASQIDDQTVREREIHGRVMTDGDVLERGLNRMLDDLERYGLRVPS